MFTNKKGFTLIEILIVIAIIGILSAAVLAGIGPARNKAKDARIVSGVNQIRAIAETVFDPSAVASYAALTASNGPYTNSTNADVLRAGADVLTQGPTMQINLTVAPGIPGSSYVAYSVLVTDATKAFCVDGKGNARQVPSANLTAALTANWSQCP